MAAQLLLAPVGAGKTESALRRIHATIEADPLATVWVLLATDRQVIEFRSRLMAYVPERTIYFNVSFFTIYELYRHLLDMAEQPVRDLNESARLRLLRVLAGRMVADGTLAVYAPIATRPGFLQVLAAFIYELKQAMAYKGELPQYMRAAFGELRPKDREIAALYDAYQERLAAHDVVDREGLGWMTYDALIDDPDAPRGVDLLVVDGYDQFTPLQTAVIALLAGRIPDVLFTLTTIPERQTTVGRRFARAEAMLQQAMTELGVPLAVDVLSSSEEPRHPDLQHTAENLMHPNREQRTLHLTDAGVRFIAQPDIPTETAAVLRAVKRLLVPDADGMPPAQPDDILVVLRDFTRYAAYIRAYGRAYGLPLALHYGEPLADTPVIRLLMAVFDLHRPANVTHDFPRRDLLDVLRSPYVRFDGLSLTDVDLLDRISREYVVVGGRETWLDALDRAALPRPQEGRDDKPPLIGEAHRDRLKAALSAFFDTITPMTTATVADYVEWIEGLIGDDDNYADFNEEVNPGALQLVQQLHATDDRRVKARDIAAVAQFKKVLKGLASAQILVDALEHAGDQIAWADFLADLVIALASATIESRPSRTGRVLVTSVTDARGLPHAHIFVMGMSEGIFPQRLPENPLYLEDERRKLYEAGLHIPTNDILAGDDGLFFEMVSQARATLTLSRPTVRNGSAWIESHLWRSTAALFDNAAEVIAANTGRVGAPPTIHEAATPNEAALAVADALNDTATTAPAIGAYNWLQDTQAALWGGVRVGYLVESGRMDDTPHNRYTGVIQHAPLLEHLRGRWGADHYWSASQLNDYGICPFRFFAARVLLLEEDEEPQLGLDARQFGVVNHAILEQTYRQLQRDGVTITPDNTDHALTVLDATADELLADAPIRYGFRVTPYWHEQQAVLRRRLTDLVTFDFNEFAAHLQKAGYPSAERVAYVQEHRFLIDSLPALDGLSIVGYIDRVDQLGDTLLLMDYKTGATKIPLEDLEAGRNVQMMFYVLAAAADFDAPIAGGLYWHIRDGATSGALHTDNPDHQAAMDAAQLKIQAAVDHINAGDFAVAPSKLEDGRCTKYCPFYRLCRVAVTNRYKSG
jgi:ATP-dependent helicase/nuclease subunit B